jgi:hypothetical protein
MALFSLNQVAALGNELQELQVDDELIAQITRDLVDNADAVDGTGFTKLHTDDAVFGRSTVGGSLGYHHTLAHAKVADTLAAVIDDLHTFRTGLQTFKKAVDSADTQSAQDLHRRHEAVTALARAADFHHTHQRNRYYHPGQQLPGAHGIDDVPSDGPNDEPRGGSDA